MLAAEKNDKMNGALYSRQNQKRVHLKKEAPKMIDLVETRKKHLVQRVRLEGVKVEVETKILRLVEESKNSGTVFDLVAMKVHKVNLILSKVMQEFFKMADELRNMATLEPKSDKILEVKEALIGGKVEINRMIDRAAKIQMPLRKVLTETCTV